MQQGSLGPTVLLSLLFPVKYGLSLITDSAGCLKEREGSVEVMSQDGGGARCDHNWAGRCTLSTKLQYLHSPPFPPPLPSLIATHTHSYTHTHTNTHTHTHTHSDIQPHTGFSTPFFPSLDCSLSLSLSLTHTHQGCQSSAFRRNSAFIFCFPLF